MSYDGRAAFLEEAQDLLAELETTLLELEKQPSECGFIQRAFRALHTIKGSGAMFGYEDVSRFTHELESAFDRVRDGRLDASPELVRIGLLARDQIQAMLDESAGRGQADSAIQEAILEQLSALVGAPAGQNKATVAAGNRTQKPDAICSESRIWRIRFRPAEEILLKGTNPLLLFRELRTLGNLVVRADFSGIPELPRIHPENCYVAWELELKTNAAGEAIRDVFLFVEDDCELSIEALGKSQPDILASTEPWTQGSIDKRRDPHSPGGDAVSIRVATNKVDQLINYVGELVVVQAHLNQLASVSELPELQVVSEEVERLVAGLRDNAMSMRMFPLKGTFARFRRLVHDLAASLEKEVEFVTEGGETELDKTVIDQLNDPLLHLIRNSMDHGLERPDARLTAGKPRQGTLRLRAGYSGATVLISIADDGRGLDVEAIRRRATEKGLIPAEAQLSHAEMHSLIFMAGFSTAQQVTSVSGRGVGLDVVKRNIETLRGTIDIASQPGAGTTVTLRLPLTLAIIDGLLVRAGHAHFVAPLSNVLECVELSAQPARRSSGKQLLDLRGVLTPYIRLRDFFGIPAEPTQLEQVLIVEAPGGRFGIAVDQVLGDHQTVIKNLGRVYRHVEVISGATILGDGTVALILDPQRLAQAAIQDRDRCAV